jgi:hypothetical protein
MPNFAGHIISLNYIVDKSPIVIIALRIGNYLMFGLWCLRHFQQYFSYIVAVRRLNEKYILNEM